MENTIDLKIENNVAILKIDRPDVRNAVNAQFWFDFEKVLYDLQDNEQVRVLFITGNEKAFSSGADLKESKTRSKEEYKRYLLHVQKVSKFLLEFPKPTIAVMQGYALGAGFELALACDLRFADESVAIGFPEAKVSSFVTGGTLKLLPELIGPAKAKELLLTCRYVNAHEALALGLVNCLYETKELFNKSLEIANTISGFSPFSVQRLKLGLHRARFADLDSIMDYEVEQCLSAVSSKEREESLKGFEERGKNLGRK